MRLLTTLALLAGAVQAFRWLDVNKPGDPYAYRYEGGFYVIEWDPEGSEGTFQLEMLSFSNYPILYPPANPGGLPVQDFQLLTTVLKGKVLQNYLLHFELILIASWLTRFGEGC
ncbi:hypothetical protein F5X97DRAFT_313383 [Nemania serpens]|nr:hypothetical protein F5X97DRAFT_313383 [Nemania serpens]